MSEDSLADIYGYPEECTLNTEDDMANYVSIKA